MTNKTTKHIEASELRYRRLFESAQDGILILDFKSGKVMDVNPFLTALLGYERDEIIGKQLWELGAIIDKTAAIKAFAVLKDKTYIRYEDLPMQKKNGEVIDVEFISNAYGVNGDRVIQCNIRDISDRKKIEILMLEYQTLTNVSMREMIRTLIAMVEFKDPYTAEHQSRVADLSVAIANELELPLHTVEGIRMSAMVHDIGKIGIPAEILTKPTPLTNYELAMVRSHAQAGFEIVKHIHFPWPLATTIHQHHERLDGSGYPKGLSGDDIIEEARIIAVADTVEAMSSDRPYRKSPGIEKALREIETGSGTLFDPAIVHACLTLFQKKNYSFSNAII